MSENVPIDPLAVLLVSGTDADCRADLIDAIQALDPDHDLAVIPGAAPALEGDLERVLAMDDVALAVIELGMDDDPALVLDTVEPLVEDDAAVLIGVLTALDAGRAWTEFRDGEATLAQHLVMGIESASLVVLMNSEGVPEDTMRMVDGLAHNLNPTAAVLRIEDLAGRTLPELAQAIAEADAIVDDTPDEDEESLAGEVDAWGFNSFTWSTAVPLDRGRFMALFEQWPVEILRAHGVVRFTDGATAVLSVVRDTVAFDEYDEAGHGDDGHDHAHDHDHDHGHEVELDGGTELDLGEDESELAFVGIDMPVADLVARLDACQAEA